MISSVSQLTPLALERVMSVAIRQGANSQADLWFSPFSDVRGVGYRASAGMSAALPDAC